MRNIVILGADNRNPQNGRILMPHVAPVIYVRQIAGKVLPDKGSINCHWNQDPKEMRVVGECEEGIELVLTGIDLNY